eukprot:CAMPEP_0195530762 /NCGR_PEP_ID=MMETSP0794_2-20130614/33814_1 /TAXON_ID=515487 /ORGANISM="Stephanopyxis turris, Strain CCMP 815" /LENGTH=201 /DNA_ID=CAMNT_0040662341 /DNA_START=222 /DNA_END=827 /DNA_ORIENTATION=-
MDQDKVLKIALEQSAIGTASLIYFMQMWLAYLFGDYQLASKMAELSRNLGELYPSRFEVVNHAFYDGLTSLILARKTKRKKWNILAENAIDKMKNWAEEGACACQHKLALLNAELAFSTERYDEAKLGYDTAIVMAGESGFIQDQALACERAAVFHLDHFGESLANHYSDQAHNYYLEWGALNKADQIRRRQVTRLITRVV